VNREQVLAWSPTSNRTDEDAVEAYVVRDAELLLPA
jgi:hypothetical protein